MQNKTILHRNIGVSLEKNGSSAKMSFQSDLYAKNKLKWKKLLQEWDY